VAIGQSTLATQRVIANLFYRGLVLRRAPRIGDSLRATTEVVALRDVTARPGRPAAGLAVLRVRTVDQLDRAVLDFYRCAMLPIGCEGSPPGHTGDLDAIGGEGDARSMRACLSGWDLERYRELLPGIHAGAVAPETRLTVQGGDTVTAAPELTRLTLNVAAAHADPGSTGHGRRLVYGGHTIGIALAHVTRALPNLVTVVGWRSCDHLAPVFEGDVLHSTIAVEDVEPPAPDEEGALVGLRVETTARRADGGPPARVLDWRLVGAMA